MRLLADENIPLSVIKFLRERGQDVVTLHELNRLGIADIEVIDLAEKDNRIVLTLDLDFGHMYYFARREKVSIIVIRPKTPLPEEIIKLSSKFLDLNIEPKGLVIISEKKIRIVR